MESAAQPLSGPGRFLHALPKQFLRNRSTKGGIDSLSDRRNELSFTLRPIDSAPAWPLPAPDRVQPGVVAEHAR